MPAPALPRLAFCCALAAFINSHALGQTSASTHKPAPPATTQTESKVDEAADDMLQGVAGKNLEEMGKKKFTEETAKKLAGGAVLVTDLATSGGAWWGGDPNKAFTEACAAFASAGTGYVASSLMAGPVAPVAGGIVVGFAAKQCAREIIESYNDYQDLTQVIAVLDGIKPSDTYRQQIGALQNAIHQANVDGNFNQVKLLSDHQQEVVAKYKTHREEAKKMAAALDKMAAVIRAAELEALRLEPAKQAAEAKASDSHIASLRAAAALDHAQQALRQKPGISREEAEKILAPLRAKDTELFEKSQQDRKAANALFHQQRSLTEQTKDWRARFAEEVARFKRAAAALPQDNTPPSLDTKLVIEAPTQCTEGDQVAINVTVKNPPTKLRIEFSEDGQKWSDLADNEDVKRADNQVSLTTKMSAAGDFTLHIRAVDPVSRLAVDQTKLTIAVDAKKAPPPPPPPAKSSAPKPDEELAAALAEYKSAQAAYQAALKQGKNSAQLREISARQQKAYQRYTELVSRKASAPTP